MDCEKALELISADIDGEGSPAGRAGLDEHLAGCAACREAQEDLTRQDAGLRRAFEPRREAAQALSDRVISRLRRPVRLSWASGPWIPMILSAAAGFLVAAVVFYRPDAAPARPLVQVAGPAAPSMPSAAPQAAAELVVATNAVEVMRGPGSAWELIVKGGRIEAGARVRTPKRVRCEFRTPEGSIVRFNGETELVFQSPRRLELARGQVFSIVARDEEPFTVLVPKDRAAVTALGTQFDVLLKPTETVLTMVHGIAKVEDPSGEELGRFEVGEQARIVQGRVGERKKGVDLVLATSWVNEVLALKGPENDEFTRRMDNLFAQIGDTKLSFLYEKEIVALGDHCVIPLVRFIQSELSRRDTAKRLIAARILQKIAQPWAIPEFIGLLGDDDPEVRVHAARTLLDQTGGHTQGVSPESWRDLPEVPRAQAMERWRAWWEKNKDDYPGGP